MFPDCKLIYCFLEYFGRLNFHFDFLLAILYTILVCVISVELEGDTLLAHQSLEKKLLAPFFVKLTWIFRRHNKKKNGCKTGKIEPILNGT